MPANIFDKKKYTYVECKQCELVFLDPIPNSSDLDSFYPESYQGEIMLERVDSNKKQPGLRFSYREHFDMIKKAEAKSILDFGCGNGHFIYNASLHQLAVDGVEFSTNVIAKLRAAMPANKFYGIGEFYANSGSYDVIRMSNVLEHFTEPLAEFEKLRSKLNANGLMIVEGPLEMNRSLVNFLKWKYFAFRKKLNRDYVTSHIPTHIFFSNSGNQLKFFESQGMRTERYVLKENAWPYPESFGQVNSPGTLFKYLIARKSIFLSYLLPNYGNTFLYVGRKG